MVGGECGSINVRDVFDEAFEAYNMIRAIRK